MTDAATPDISSIQAMLQASICAMHAAGVRDFSGLSFTNDIGRLYWDGCLSEMEKGEIRHKMAVAGLLGSDGRPDASTLFTIALSLEADARCIAALRCRDEEIARDRAVLIRACDDRDSSLLNFDRLAAADPPVFAAAPGDLFAGPAAAAANPARFADPPMPLTEADWATSREPNRMLAHIGEAASERKLRLVTVAAARLVWEKITDPETRSVVETAEQLADGLAAPEALQWYRDRLQRCTAPSTSRERWASYWSSFAQVLATTYRASMISHLPRLGVWSFVAAQFADQIAPIVRDIFVNPFQPVVIDPHWRTSDVLAVARAIYDDRTYELLPILSDALMDAGCDDENILQHCQSAGPHVRGCWVVDLILNRQ